MNSACPKEFFPDTLSTGKYLRAITSLVAQQWYHEEALFLLQNGKAAMNFAALQMLTWIVEYLKRHRHPANRMLHAIGLPLSFLVPIGCLVAGEWVWALGAFVAGYALQFLGHAVEGNDAGEMILIKKRLGLPYVAVVPRPSARPLQDADRL